MTREEAIMVLKNEQPHCGKKALFPEEKKYEAYNVAVKALEQKTRWIPVSSKRMPKNSGNYLITYCLRDEIETQEAVYIKEEDKWFDVTDIEITLAVIAWMPLPKPYQAEREG